MKLGHVDPSAIFTQSEQGHAPPLTSCCSLREGFRLRSEAKFSGGPIWRPE